MQGVVADFGELLVGRDRQGHVGHLHADLEVVEIVLLEDVGVIEGNLTSALGLGSPYFSSRCFSSDPAFTPMRIEQPWSRAAFNISRRARRCRCCRG